MNDVLIVGALLLVLIGATTFYLYSRILFTERKMGLIESILLDIKMNMEMVDERRVVEGAGPGPAIATATAQAPAAEADEAAFYRDVIETTAETVVAEATTTEAPTFEEVVATPMPAGPDYDSMSRDELGSVAEKRGLRVTKRMSRSAVIALLREADKNTSGPSESGGNGIPGASLDEPADGAPLSSGEAEEVNLDE